MAKTSADGRWVQELLFEKKLSKSDLEKLYIPKQHVHTILPAALKGEGPNAKKLLLYDSVLNGWLFQLSETTGGRFFLSGSNWACFIGTKNISEGNTIGFYELTWDKGSMRKFLQIGRLTLFGEPIDLNQP